MSRDKSIVIIGLPFFASMIAKRWQEEGKNAQYLPMDSFYNKIKGIIRLYKADVVYRIGGIDRGKLSFLLSLKPKGKIVLHWCGSDVLNVIRDFKNGSYNKKFLLKAIHLAGAPWLAAELKQIGIYAEVIPLVSLQLFEDPPPLPTKFRLLVYLTTDKPIFYGRSVIYKLAEEMPDVEFLIVGSNAEDHPKPPQNLSFMGYVKDMKEIYSQVTALIRFTEHDGFSFMVIEALSAGRYVFWTYPLEGVIQVKSYEQLKNEVIRLKKDFLDGDLGLNSEGLRAVRNKYNPKEFYEKLYNKLIL
jgi:glycosyltransferase involved in cell wall biosynthesis